MAMYISGLYGGLQPCPVVATLMITIITITITGFNCSIAISNIRSSPVNPWGPVAPVRPVAPLDPVDPGPPFAPAAPGTP